MLSIEDATRPNKITIDAEKVFPAEMPVKGKLDFEFLAKQFKITGGNIKNIALKAAYYAAEDGNGVKMKHLVRAIKRELQKIGKLYSNTDFGTYSKLT